MYLFQIKKYSPTTPNSLPLFQPWFYIFVVFGSPNWAKKKKHPCSNRVHNYMLSKCSRLHLAHGSNPILTNCPDPILQAKLFPTTSKAFKIAFHIIEILDIRSFGFLIHSSIVRGGHIFMINNISPEILGIYQSPWAFCCKWFIEKKDIFKSPAPEGLWHRNFLPLNQRHHLLILSSPP